MQRKVFNSSIVLCLLSLWSFELNAELILESEQQAETEPNLTLADNSINEKLLEAVFLHDVNGVQQALEAGANSNGRDFLNQRSPVENAIISMPSLKWENFNRDEDKNWAREKEKDCIEVLKKLFDAGAEVKQSYLRWPIDRNSVLILKLLLKHGLDPNAPISEELTPMELAVKCGSQDVVDFLIKEGVKSISPKAAAQLSLFDAAENHNIIRMEKSLRKGAKLNCGFKGNRISALMIAIGRLNFCFSESEAYGAISYLLQKGANPNFAGPNDITSLHLAMYSTKIYLVGNEDRLIAESTYRRLSLEALIKAGANVSTKNHEGITPLHIAAIRDNLLGAEVLLEHGANINLKDKDGKTPLDYAESADMIKLLKSHGAKEQ